MERDCRHACFCEFYVVNKVNSTLSLKSTPRKTAPSFQLSQRQNYFRHKMRRYQDTGQLIGRIKPCRLQISPQSTPIRQGGGRFDGSRPVPPLLTFCAGFAGWVGVGHTCAGKMYSFCRHRGESLKKQASTKQRATSAINHRNAKLLHLFKYRQRSLALDH